MKSILDPSFKYTSSANTDIARTFARIRREQRRTAESAALPPANVASLAPRRALPPKAA